MNEKTQSKARTLLATVIQLPERINSMAAAKCLTEIFYDHFKATGRRYLYVLPKHTRSGESERIEFSGFAPHVKKSAYAHVALDPAAVKIIRKLFDFERLDPPPPAPVVEPIVVKPPTAKQMSVDEIPAFDLKDFRAAKDLLEGEYAKLSLQQKITATMIIELWLRQSLIEAGRLLGGGKNAKNAASV